MVKFFLVRKSYGTFGYKVSVFCRDEDGQAIEALKCKTTFNPVRQRVFQVKRTNINYMVLQEGMICIFFLSFSFLCHSERYHGQNGYYTSEPWIEQSGSKSLPKHCARAMNYLGLDGMYLKFIRGLSPKSFELSGIRGHLLTINSGVSTKFKVGSWCK